MTTKMMTMMIFSLGDRSCSWLLFVCFLLKDCIWQTYWVDLCGSTIRLYRVGELILYHTRRHFCSQALSALSSVRTFWFYTYVYVIFSLKYSSSYQLYCCWWEEKLEGSQKSPLNQNTQSLFTNIAMQMVNFKFMNTRLEVSGCQQYC